MARDSTLRAKRNYNRRKRESEDAEFLEGEAKRKADWYQNNQEHCAAKVKKQRLNARWKLPDKIEPPVGLAQHERQLFFEIVDAYRKQDVLTIGQTASGISEKGLKAVLGAIKGPWRGMIKRSIAAASNEMHPELVPLSGRVPQILRKLSIEDQEKVIEKGLSVATETSYKRVAWDLLTLEQVEQAIEEGRNVARIRTVKEQRK